MFTFPKSVKLSVGYGGKIDPTDPFTILEPRGLTKYSLESSIDRFLGFKIVKGSVRNKLPRKLYFLVSTEIKQNYD